MTEVFFNDLLHSVVDLLLLSSSHHSARELEELDAFEAIEVVEVDRAAKSVATILKVLVLVLVEHDHSHFGAIRVPRSNLLQNEGGAVGELLTSDVMLALADEEDLSVAVVLVHVVENESPHEASTVLISLGRGDPFQKEALVTFCEEGFKEDCQWGACVNFELLDDRSVKLHLVSCEPFHLLSPREKEPSQNEVDAVDEAVILKGLSSGLVEVGQNKIRAKKHFRLIRNLLHMRIQPSHDENKRI